MDKCDDESKRLIMKKLTVSESSFPDRPPTPEQSAFLMADTTRFVSKRNTEGGSCWVFSTHNAMAHDFSLFKMGGDIVVHCVRTARNSDSS